MDLCPVCGARQAAAAPSCRRCRSDLTELAAIAARAEKAARLAVQALAMGKMDMARHWAARARALHATPLHRHLAGFCAGVIATAGMPHGQTAAPDMPSLKPQLQCPSESGLTPLC